jgi:hypothetical protein
MPIQTPKSPSLYQQEILLALQATGVRQTAPGGKARALADVIASVLGESEVQQFGLVTSTLLPYASGDVLDFLGSIYGVPRLARQDGAVSILDDNFQFYALVSSSCLTQTTSRGRGLERPRLGLSIPHPSDRYACGTAVSSCQTQTVSRGRGT